MAELFGFTIARKNKKINKKTFHQSYHQLKKMVLLRLRLVVLMGRMLILRAKQRTKANL